MKIPKISLFLHLFLILSSASYAESNRKTSPTKSSSAISHNDFPNIFRPIGNFFKRIFGKKEEIGACTSANVMNLSLSRTEIVRQCSASNGNFCLKSPQTIEVLTEAIDPENDVLIYAYFVKGGKIIGEGAKVIWDLSEAPSGNYTITAAVDDGCGFCGQSLTREIKIVECADCQNP